MRIVTRPDFDGVVCAVLLRDAIDADLPIFWAEPGDMQQGRSTFRRAISWPTSRFTIAVPCGSTITTPTYRHALSRGFLKWRPPRRA